MMKFLLKTTLALASMFVLSLVAFGSAAPDYISHAFHSMRAWFAGAVAPEVDIAVAERDLAQIDASIEAVGQQIATHEVGLVENQRELDTVQGRVEQQAAEMRLIRAQDRNAMSASRLDQLERYTMELVARHELDRERVASLQQQIATQREALGDLRRLRQQMESERHACQLEIDRLRMECARLDAERELRQPFEGATDNVLPAVRERLADVRRRVEVAKRVLADDGPPADLRELLGQRSDVFARLDELVGDSEPAVAAEPPPEELPNPLATGVLRVNGSLRIR
ncbi:MAG: hypothetical protein IPM29_28420 [Planctomycetes bacterium]|nr:hypothetical protein [Planctomycetota bacterium]